MMGAKITNGAGRPCLVGLASLIILWVFAAPAQADFGFAPGSFELDLRDGAGDVVNPAQAGAHPPNQQVSFSFNTIPHTPYPSGEPDPVPDGAPKTIVTELPPGLIGNPDAVPHCSLSDFPPETIPQDVSRCPTDSQIGVAELVFSTLPGRKIPPGFEPDGVRTFPVYNLEAPEGVLAEIGFTPGGIPVVIDISIRSSGDFGLNATLNNVSEAINLYSSKITLWGVPADSSHDAKRFLPEAFFPGFQSDPGNLESAPGPPIPSKLKRIPFLSNPTRCNVDLFSRVKIDSWQNPGKFLSYTATPMKFTGCDRVDFEPTIDAKPTTALADAPSGLDFHLHLAQHETLAQNEVQSLKVLANEGKYTISFNGETSAFEPEPSFNASFLQLVLEFMPAIGPGNVVVTGGPGDATGSSPYQIQFRNALGQKDVPELVIGEGTSPLKITTGPEPVDGAALITTETPGTEPGEVGAESSTAHLRDAIVTLPEGLTVNPSSADVLDACSLEQVGMSKSGVANGQDVTCPDASILGKATVDSPPINHPLPATIYLARQDENPFGSLLAMYLVIDDPASGLLIKLPGKIDPDPKTGRLTVSFRENPQTPVEDLEMHFFPGPHAALKTPETCGLQTVTSEMVPWSAPEGETKKPTSSFSLTGGPDGGACPPSGAEAANKPSFIAGTADPTAKAFSPFSLKISRGDGTQQLRGIDTTLPPGLLAKLAGATNCSELDIYKAEQRASGKAEQASPSCPASSKVGTVTVGSGAGPAPIYVSADAYLAGPYKGAPISLVVIAPAVAGPFDLGNVVVRNALHVDPITAQVRAVSDPFPTILKGIPLDLRSIALKIDRPNFTFNPTSCEPMAVKGSATSVFNQDAGLSSYFQADECGALGFKPKLRLALKGRTGRRAHPSLRATLTARPGDANVARAQVKLPKAAFLDNAHIGDVCTRVQFAAQACPASSIYGRAEATSPLVDYPVAGPVYLRSSDHKLPDLVADLRGPDRQPIEVTLAGKVDAVHGALRNTFEAVPDVPVTKFRLILFGGKKGLIVMSEGFCAHPRASVKFTGQNGLRADSTPKVFGKCGAHGKKKRKRGGR
jgi:hypothetical protein